ncbi:unnamed protein product, partial [Prorocentrum cordatum]
PNPASDEPDVRVSLVIQPAEPAGFPVPPPLAKAEEHVAIPRQLYIRTADLVKFGCSAGCLGCEAHRDGKPPVAHSQVCRARPYPLMRSSLQGQLREERQKRRPDDYKGRSSKTDPAENPTVENDSKRQNVSQDVSVETSLSASGQKRTSSAAGPPEGVRSDSGEAMTVEVPIPAQAGPASPASGSAGIGLSGSYLDAQRENTNAGELSAMPQSIAQSVDIDSFHSLQESFRKLGYNTCVSELVDKFDSEVGLCHGLDATLVLDFTRVNPRYGRSWDFSTPAHRKNAIMAVNTNMPLLVIGAMTVGVDSQQRKDHVRFLNRLYNSQTNTCKFFLHGSAGTKPKQAWSGNSTSCTETVRKWCPDGFLRTGVSQTRFSAGVLEGFIDELYCSHLLSLNSVGVVLCSEAPVPQTGDYSTYWDNLSGAPLEISKVLEARQAEMKEVEKHNVYTKVPISECFEKTGRAPIGTRWVDVNKGDENRPEYRSRIVAQELKKLEDRDDTFAATPPLEALKFIFSLCMTETP